MNVRPLTSCPNHNKNIVYLGINVYPGQDAHVLEFLKNTKYSLIPLRGSTDFALKHYGVKGEPESFIIDKEGKVIFQKFMINALYDQS